MRSPEARIPEGFSRLDLSSSLFLETSGPFYARRAEGEVTIGMRVERRHCNSMGTMHGGMILAFTDVSLTVGSNILAKTKRFLPTLSVTCDFIGPAKAGDWVQVPVKVLRVTRSYVFSQALIETLEGAPVARVSGTLLIRGEPDPKYDGERYFR
jgi:uncharacterized protein (TIGR00369 family)